MAAINDLIAQIEDRTLRERLKIEAERITKDKKFGLVFEEHLPELTKPVSYTHLDVYKRQILSSALV